MRLRHESLQLLAEDPEFLSKLHRLIYEAESPALLGFALGELGHYSLEDLLLNLPVGIDDQHSDLLRGFIAAKHNHSGTPWLMSALKYLVQNGRMNDAARATADLVPGTSLWSLIEQVGNGLPETYWKLLGPDIYGELTRNERLHAIRRLLEASRPASALVVLSHWNRKHDDPPPSEIILETLEACIADADSLRTLSTPGGIGYRINNVLGMLGKLEERGLERAIRIESFFLPLLGQFGGTPRLFRALGETPRLFALAVSLAHSPDEDMATDSDLQKQTNSRRAALDILHTWKGTPGEQASSPEERDAVVEAWCRAVGQELTTTALREMGWRQLACVLARSPSLDGVWPCRAARNLLEEGIHPELRRFMRTAKWNLRGLVMRSSDEGGAQERDLATRFRKDEVELRAQGFSVAATLARELAERYDWESEDEDSQAAEWRDP
ncbi:hypothetical protein [Corallococcus sp. AB038B]|uniref:hypothetical protein n=1 Tax=Corallococcus sp. AB038B TaxID=2316718 RepID=UPI0011C3F512|nr:hypothetical protein [Corallococcus sp. AB038B]